jgi:predicted Fe-Mo cluster-binding NifX family protein
MKIAVACMNEFAVSAHFGRAEKYMVYEVEDGQVRNKKMLPKPGHRHYSQQQPGQHGHESSHQGSGFGHHARCKHEEMFENIRDCDVLLVGGMGRGAYLDLQKHGIRPIVTDITDVEKAVQAVLDETIVDHTEQLH